jgi:hypothetical protein
MVSQVCKALDDTANQRKLEDAARANLFGTNMKKMK